jgi:hypothetical protein
MKTKRPAFRHGKIKFVKCGSHSAYIEIEDKVFYVDYMKHTGEFTTSVWPKNKEAN